MPANLPNPTQSNPNPESQLHSWERPRVNPYTGTSISVANPTGATGFTPGSVAANPIGGSSYSPGTLGRYTNGGMALSMGMLSNSVGVSPTSQPNFQENMPSTIHLGGGPKFQYDPAKGLAAMVNRPSISITPPVEQAPTYGKPSISITPPSAGVEPFKPIVPIPKAPANAPLPHFDAPNKPLQLPGGTVINNPSGMPPASGGQFNPIVPIPKAPANAPLPHPEMKQQMPGTPSKEDMDRFYHLTHTRYNKHSAADRDSMAQLLGQKAVPGFVQKENPSWDPTMSMSQWHRSKR